MFILKVLDTPIKIIGAAAVGAAASGLGYGVSTQTAPAEYVEDLKIKQKSGGEVTLSNYEFYLSWGGENAFKNLKLEDGKESWILLFFKEDICKQKKDDETNWGGKVKFSTSEFSDYIKCFEILP